jgi:hypothetical protein
VVASEVPVANSVQIIVYLGNSYHWILGTGHHWCTTATVYHWLPLGLHWHAQLELHWNTLGHHWGQCHPTQKLMAPSWKSKVHYHGSDKIKKKIVIMKASGAHTPQLVSLSIENCK